MCVHEWEKEIKVTVTVSIGVNQTLVLATEACRRLRPQETAFWKRGQPVRPPFVNDLSCLMGSLTLINICLWHYLQFTKLLAAFCLPSVVNHLPLLWVPQGVLVDSGWGGRGMGTRTFKSREMLEAADVGGQAFCSPALVSLSFGTTFLFLSHHCHSPRRGFSGVSLTHAHLSPHLPNKTAKIAHPLVSV